MGNQGLARIRALSPRQAEAVAHTWRGLTRAEIARRMGCTRETVHQHLRAAYRALDFDRQGRDPRGDPRTAAAVALWAYCAAWYRGAG